jgi:hypothetical protein
MSRKKNIPLPVGLLVGALALGMMADTIAAEIVPIDALPYSASYGEWAARWWQWVLQTPGPTSEHPAFDNSGAKCGVGQKGDVWFIGAQFDSNGPVVHRSCTIPKGKSLFLPLANQAYFAFLKDAPKKSTGAALRQRVTCVDDPAPGAASAVTPKAVTFGGLKLEATIDGAPVDNPQQYFVRSSLFTVELPTNNILGLTEKKVKGLLLTPGITTGYYLFLNPLSPGQHVIHWTSERTCPSGEFSQDITYDLTIQ